ncbi:UBP9-binding protein, partial [Smittium culicis]
NPNPDVAIFKEPVYDSPVESIVGPPGLKKHIILQNKIHVLAIDSENEISLWDLLLAKKIKVFDSEWGTDLESIADSMNHPSQTVASWCNIDTKIGMLTVQIKITQAWDAEIYIDQLSHLSFDQYKKFIANGVERIKIGPWMLKNLFEKFNKLNSEPKNITHSIANSLSKWSSENPNGSSMTFSEILDTFKVPDEIDLLEFQPITPNVSESNQTDSNTQNSDLDSNNSSTIPENKNQKQSNRSSKFLSFKLFKNKKDKKLSDSNDAKTQSSNNDRAKSNANMGNNSDPTLPIDQENNPQLRTYNHLKENDKNLIILKSFKNASEVNTYSIFDLYPSHELPSNLKIIVLEEDTNNEVPSCIYESSFPKKGEKLRVYSQHNITDDIFLTFTLSLPSWVVDYIYLHRFPLSYAPPNPLLFSLSPSPAPFMQLPSLGLGNNLLSAHQMLRVTKISAYISEKLRVRYPPMEYFDSVSSLINKFANEYPVESKDLKNAHYISQNQTGLSKNTSSIKCYWEIAMEKLGESLCDEERLLLRAFSKLPKNQLPKVLSLTLTNPKDDIGRNTLNPSSPNDEVCNEYNKNTELEKDTDDTQILENSDSTNPSNNPNNINFKSISESNTESNSKVAQSDIADEFKSLTLENKADHMEPENTSGAIINPTHEINNINSLTVSSSQRMSNLSFLWMDIICKDSILDPSTTLNTIRTFYWKSSQEMMISYRWKKFIVTRVKNFLSD